MRVRPAKAAVQRFGIGIEEQLMGVEAVPAAGIVRTIDAITIERARPRIGQIAMPDLIAAFRQGAARDLAHARGVEQAELDLRRIGGEEREIDPLAVPGGAQRIGQARFYPSWRHSIFSLARVAL